MTLHVVYPNAPTPSGFYVMRYYGGLITPPKFKRLVRAWPLAWVTA